MEVKGCLHYLMLVIVLQCSTDALSPSNDQQIKTQDKCGNFTDGLTELLSSPGYPNHYLANLDCRKLIRAGRQFYIILKFLMFNLEASESCRYDYIEIRDGMYGFSPLLFKGCGADIRQGKVFESTGQYMWVRFVSDALIQDKGFLAKISAAPKAEPLVNVNNYFECHNVIKNVMSFDFGDKTLPAGFFDYYRKNPDKQIECVWDITMPAGSKVFIRITNYTATHLSNECEFNFIETYDLSTASTDVRRQDCLKPYSAYISGASRALLRLHAQSINSMPEFYVIGNIYVPEATGNCTDDTMFSCHDTYCIPRSLLCDENQNCGEGYDEDCDLDKSVSRFETKYIALFVVVIVGSLMLTTLMTLSEVVQRRKDAKKECESKPNKDLETYTTIGPKTSKQSSPNHPKDQCIDSCKDHCSSTTVDSITGTFRNSQFNANVSFRKPSRTPPNLPARNNGLEKIYQTPHISLPSRFSSMGLPPAPPTPPPPPAPPEEGRGFRLIYDLTNLGRSAAANSFEYPPPPSFLRDEESQDNTSEDYHYTSTSSSSFNSLPKEHMYDVACLERRRAQNVSKSIVTTPLIHATDSQFLPNKFHAKRIPPPVKPKPAAPKTPVTTKRSWTFDDDTDDGAMELTTYISTC